jgi:murein DD-endopeptidase MepM/ murein hydrolase activator NlpD
LIAAPQVASAASSSAQPPSGWLTYTNSLQAYKLSYPSTWYHWKGPQDASQYFSTYDPKTAPPDFPAAKTDVKVEVAVLQKPATQSLENWLKARDADLWPGGPPDKNTDGEWTLPVVQRNVKIAGHAAMTLFWKHVNSTREEVYFDGGGFAYEVAAMWALAVDPKLMQQVLSSFSITGTPKFTHQAPASPTTRIPLTHFPSGLTLPFQIDYAWCCSPAMSSIGMNGGGVNSWFDHDGPTYACNNSLTRYDGAVYSPNWCSGTNVGSCTTSVSCYDGHPGIDFSTNRQVDIPIYASASGTIQYYSDTACGTGLYLILGVNLKGYPLKILYCHLDSTLNYILPNNSSVLQGQEIALSGCSGSGCGGPHLHFAVYRLPDPTLSSSKPIDPNGWTGGGTDPWPYDIGYLWISNPPSFIGGNIYTVTPTLTGPSQWWHHQASDQYGVASDWTTTDSSQSPTNVAYWYAPGGVTCGAVEVWIPSGDATANPAKFIISFSDGTPDKTVSVDQNDNTSWYTIYDWYYGGHTISQVRMVDNTGTPNQMTAAAQAWFSCY